MSEPVAIVPTECPCCGYRGVGTVKECPECRKQNCPSDIGS
jgi:hypothetical protein